MSNILKQDTFYAEFGDPGRIYTYPDRLTVRMTLPSGRVFFSQSFGTVHSTVATSSSKQPAQSFAGTLTVSGTQIVGYSGIHASQVSVLRTEPLESIYIVAAQGTLFADFQSEDPKVLNSHHFVLTGG